MPLPSFLIDTTKGDTPEGLARRRALLQAMSPNYGKAQNVGEGLGQLFMGIGSGIQNRRLNKAEAAGKAQGASAYDKIISAMGGNKFPAAPGGYGAPQPQTNDAMPPVSTAPVGNVQRALLDTIAGPESAGAYDVIYGGKKFNNFGDHPRVAVPIKTGPNAGKTSSAAGKYQFLGSTWDAQKKKLGLTDFSPENQDRAALDLAATVYKQKTGQDLNTVLQSGDPNAIAGIGKALNSTWTSLPGGIEQGTNTDRFVSTLQKNMGAPQNDFSNMGAVTPFPTQNGGAQAIQQMLSTGQQSQAPQPLPQGQFDARFNGIAPPEQAPQGLPAAQPMPQEAPQPALQGPQGVPAMPTGPTSFERVLGLDTPGNTLPQQTGPDIQMLMQAARNPWLNENDRAVVQTLLQNELKKQDPAYQMQQQSAQIGLQKGQLELDNLQNPQPKVEQVGNQLVKIHPDGRIEPVFQAGNGPDEKTAGQKDYEFAVQQLRERGVPDDKLPTFQEWSKPKSRGISFTGPDGTRIQIGGDASAGGLDGTSIPAEVGARIGLGQSFLTKDYPEIIKMIDQGDATGPIDWITGKLGQGNSGIVQRRIASGVDALRRGLTGAGMSMSETDEYASRYSPQWNDTPQTLRLKAEGLKQDLEAVSSGAINGKAGNIGGLMQGPSSDTAPDITQMSDEELEAIINGQ